MAGAIGVAGRWLVVVYQPFEVVLVKPGDEA